MVYSYKTMFNRDPPYQKKSKTSWWPFTKGGGGTLEQTGKFNPSTWQRKGSRGQEGGLQRSTSEKNGDFLQIGHRIPPKQKNNKKTHKKKNTLFQVNSERSIFLLWLFCSMMLVIITFKSICLLYSFSSVIYYSKSTFNKPSRGHRVLLSELPPRHGHKGIEGRHIVDPCCTWTETTKKWIHQFRKPISVIKEQK